ncbi:hypothetical protein H6B11_02625 [Mediterraneibacter glycyrrhizinilyticus]|nr:hypothetical protein [Mediterraneibacter glycyrrhizinilyticus]MBM6853061.1 hypothetical protein [Mediterraneibacter glycyrrhizinilyticus]
MSSADKKISDIFDDDFEVTYEEDPGINLKMSGDTRRIDSVSDETVVMSDRTYRDLYGKNNRRFDEYGDDFEDDEEEDDYEYDRKRRRSSGYDDDYDDDYDERRSRGGHRKRSRGGVPLAAPIQKGGKALSRITGALLRQLSVILILATMIYVTYTFWRASAPYGDIEEALRQQSITQTLASYLCVVAVFLLFELISLLWTMTRVRMRNGVESWKEDTGRGFLSFIIVFVSSYMCFLFSRFLPETPEVIYGAKGALEVYGSMHNILLGLCAAGAISCLIRRYYRP